MNISQKEEFRYQFAGMAMQAIIQASTTPLIKRDIDILFEHNPCMSIGKNIAILSLLYADALIAELDRKDKP